MEELNYQLKLDFPVLNQFSYMKSRVGGFFSFLSFYPPFFAVLFFHPFSLNYFFGVVTCGCPILRLVLFAL